VSCQQSEIRGGREPSSSHGRGAAIDVLALKKNSRAGIIWTIEKKGDGSKHVNGEVNQEEGGRTSIEMTSWSWLTQMARARALIRQISRV